MPTFVAERCMRGAAPTVWRIVADSFAAFTPEDARDMLAEAGVVAVVCATRSRSPDAPRWLQIPGWKLTTS
tara:strand:+ start:114893 stop:115105 length:213 start_codon:yes stop_codon:yes gene_type:complete